MACRGNDTSGLERTREILSLRSRRDGGGRYQVGDGQEIRIKRGWWGESKDIRMETRQTVQQSIITSWKIEMGKGKDEGLKKDEEY